VDLKDLKVEVEQELKVRLDRLDHKVKLGFKVVLEFKVVLDLKV
jgi:hypothetical protein